MNLDFDVAGAFMATPSGLKAILPEGREIHPDALKFSPMGHRVLVLLDEVPTEYGGITIPEEYRDKEKMGAGRVIGVGSSVGSGQARFPGGPVLEHPKDLLYRHIVFGQYAGKPIRLDFIRDDKYMSSVIILTEIDIWMIDWREEL